MAAQAEERQGMNPFFIIRRTVSSLVACCAAILMAAPSIGRCATAQEILAASDAIRNPEHPFGVTVTLTEYRSGKQTDHSGLMVYSKTDATTGQYRNLVRIVSPSRDANKLMLKTGNDMWFFDPRSKASIRISPQQRLLGQAANGDVITVNFAKDYAAQSLGMEEVTDGDKNPRQCHHLQLKAVLGDVTYEQIEMWIDAASNRPVKARFLSASGQLLKTAYYRRYETQLGAIRPTETVIIDGGDPGWVTLIRGSQYVQRDVPDFWFQRDYLPRFSPD
jgi:outer membrane lipoprotein-sorting protein